MYGTGIYAKASSLALQWSVYNQIPVKQLDTRVTDVFIYGWIPQVTIGCNRPLLAWAIIYDKLHDSKGNLS